MFFKLRELKPDLIKSFDSDRIPKLHYLEKFPEFVNLCKAANEIQPEYVQTLYTEWLDYVIQRDLPKSKNNKVVFPSDFLLGKEDQISMAKCMKDQQSHYFKEIQNKVTEYGLKK